MPASAAAASTCAGRNGPIAVGAAHGIGIVTPGRQVRRTLKEAPRAGDRYTNYDPSFSCDRRWIVYENFTEADCNNIEVIDVRAGERRIYTSGKGYVTTGFPSRHHCPTHPAFLGDGRIVFSTGRGGRTSGGTFVVDVDGSHMRRLFAAQEQACTVDGRWFVAGDAGSHKLYLLNSRGRRVRALTPVPAAHGGEFLNPSLSPGGRWIVYEKLIPERSRRSPEELQLFVVRRDGTHRRLLSTGSSRFEATFSPDSRRIAFTRHPGHANGGNVLELTLAHPGRVRALTRLHGLGVTSPNWGAR